ncbi:MAG TPA: glycoside hydrolase family 97 protein [Puia sp.]|nr:glycoside hydrolase family 97 protein [Puia sp.]
MRPPFGLFRGLLLCIGVILHSVCIAGDITLSSPDGRLRFEFRSGEGLPVYSVWYRDRPVIVSSPLSLVFRGSGNNPVPSVLGPGLRALTPGYRQGLDEYALPVGRNSKVRDRYKECTIPLWEPGARRRRIDLVVRLYDDGLAFRWTFPKQHGWSAYALLAENTGFRLAGDPVLLASFLPGFTTSHENRYTRLALSEVRPDTLMDMPVFIQWPGDSLCMVITEAQLTDYAGMYLVKHDGMLKSDLSPLPGGPPDVENSPVAAAAAGAVRVKAILPHQTPWRVLFIGPRPGAFLESNLLTDLNAPCALKDVSWLHPGKTDFHWWNGDILPDTTISPGINFETNQYYIDFCARNGIEYHTVIGFGGIAWYTNDGVSYDAGPHSDPSKPIPGLDIKQICDYAASKGVGVRVWVHWKALWPHIDSAFARFERWGIKGMMVDFLNRDDQEMVNIQTAILKKAARHHLHIQFHGAYKPTGLIRTWPNELTREGTLNYENDKWNDPITPDDDLNVVFTRLMAGATDYHLGGFRAVTPQEYKPRFTRPLVLGTRCHMLAMYIVLESYLPMVCDYPAAYEGQPGFDFLKSVPSTWDETRVPVAIPREWVAIARRKGQLWWLGAINSSVGRVATIPLDFLPAGNYEVTIWRDSPDAGRDPNQLIKETRTINAGGSLTIALASGGGCAMQLRKVAP